MEEKLINWKKMKHKSYLINVFIRQEEMGGGAIL